MKIKTSMKQATLFADRVFRAGYCDMYSLLHGYETGYNAGVYGWNCDIIYLYADGKRVCITTGYRNMRGDLIPETLRKEYESRAREIIEDRDYSKRRERIAALQTEFARALLAL